MGHWARKTVVDSSGRFGFVLNGSNDATISILARNAATGALTPVAGTPFAKGARTFAVTP